MATYDITFTVRGNNIHQVKKALDAVVTNPDHNLDCYPHSGAVLVEKRDNSKSRATRLAEARAKIEEAQEEIDNLKEEISDWYENMSEGLQMADKGCALETCRDELTDVYDELSQPLDAIDNIEFPGMMG